MENLIGRKVKGFKFKPRVGLMYQKCMDYHIDEVGVIFKINEHNNSYKVKFKDDFWSYPAELIEQHLID